MRPHLRFAIVLALATLLIPVPARGTSLSIIVHPHSVHALYATQLDAYINLNGTGPFIPGNATITLNSTTYAEFAAFISALNNTLQAQSSGAMVSNLFMRVYLSSPDQYTLNLTMTAIMNVSGVITSQGTTEIVDLSLRRITVNQSLTLVLGSTTVNENAVASIGGLSGVLDFLSTLPSVNVMLNGHSSTISTAKTTIATAHTFNFASLGVDLSQWYTVHATGTNTTYLTLDTGPTLSLDVTSKTTSLGQTYTAHVQILQDPTGSITSPGYATGRGDHLYIYPTQEAAPALPALPEGIIALLSILMMPLLIRRRALTRKTRPT